MQLSRVFAYKWYVLSVIVFAAVAYYFIVYRQADTTTAAYAVVASVERGTVSSGIQTTGKIVAAKKLDLTVYAQTRRIESVNAANGGRVEEGATILSFDKSDAYVDVQSGRVAIQEKILALENAQKNYTDPNTAVRTKEREIDDLKKSITDAEQDKIDALRDFLNADLSAEPHNANTNDKTRPTLSGRYGGEERGEYVIEIYRSGAESGFSYRVSGLESDTSSVFVGIATPIGTRGLKILFPTDIQNNDRWIISVPNTYASTYAENQEEYEQAIKDLDQTITNARVSIANKEVELADLRDTDSGAYRDLDVAKAEAELAEAREQLSQYSDVVREQDIVAPFSGTIEGMENVVVGATPTRESDDLIVLGTLISDEFLIDFSLGVVDVAKVKVGQKVIVTITSFPNAAPLEAQVTEISSLPDAEGVAQYGVQALISLPADASFQLREGLLADVEIVEREVTDVVRIPLSAVSYENGKATVEALGDLSEEDAASVASLGVLRSESGVFPSYPLEVTLGVTGSYYAEVTSDLPLGTKIIVSRTNAEEGVVSETRFGPGGEGRPQEGGSTEGAQSGPPGG